MDISNKFAFAGNPDPSFCSFSTFLRRTLIFPDQIVRLGDNDGKAALFLDIRYKIRSPRRKVGPPRRSSTVKKKLINGKASSFQKKARGGGGGGTKKKKKR